MNLISAEDKILASFKTAMQMAYPHRVVTRSLLDFADRQPDELKAGVFTILANGLPEGDIYFQHMKFLVVGQIQLSEKATGEDVERAEMLLSRDIRNLVQRQLRGPSLHLGALEQSAQLEAPYGWVSVSITAGPYDATEPLTDDEGLGNLMDFLTFKADIDVGRPHQSAQEHKKWAQEPPITRSANLTRN